MHLDAFESTNSNGDHIRFLLFHYLEAGSYHKPIKLGTENVIRHWIIAPEVTRAEIACLEKGKGSLLY